MAAASPYQAARIIYQWAAGDDSRVAKVREWFDDAVEGAFGSKGGANAIQNASKNGVAYSVLVALDETSRLTAIEWALQCLAAGSPPSSRTRIQF